MDQRGHLQKRGRWAGLDHPEASSPDISVLGIPYDGAACYRKGASEGPDRIRRLSAEIPPVLETQEVLEDLVIRDDGNIPFGSDFVASYPEIEAKVARQIQQSFLLTLGGDHSVVIPVHQAFSRAATQKIGLVFIDAHADLCDRFQGSRYSNACPLRRAMEAAMFSPEAILVGTRCLEPEGLKFIETHPLKIFSAAEVCDRGIKAIAVEIVKRFSSLSNVYLSIDIDVLDPAFAPGTGIPDAGGLSTRDLMTLIRMLDPLPLVGADLVEVAPPLDHSDITSFAALRIIMEIFALVHRRKIRRERFTLL